jgi:glycosyltransferase involved in cell wall biosynthesis
MRVLLVSHHYPPFGVAGVERVSQQSAETLLGRGHEVTVLTRRPSGAPPRTMVQRELRGGVPIVSLVGGGTEVERFPGPARRLEIQFESLLLELEPDVVLITHLLHHSPGYVAIARRWGIPVVLELHDFFSLCPRAHLRRRSGELCGGPEGGAACARHCFQGEADAERRWGLRERSFAAAVRGADLALAPSRFLADALAPLRAGAAPIEVLANAVAPLGPVLRGAEPAAPLRLASIGVTAENKGFHVVVEALGRAGLAAAQYTVFGVALRPEVRRLRAAAAPVSGLQLRFFGAFSPSHLPALLADVDAMVIPSLVAESYSIVAREAFACGLPVIASRIGALPEAIREGRNGWLFAPGDAAELGALLQRLDADRGLLAQARAGIEPGDMTSVEARTDRLEELLQRACSQPPQDAYVARR